MAVLSRRYYLAVLLCYADEVLRRAKSDKMRRMVKNLLREAAANRRPLRGPLETSSRLLSRGTSVVAHVNAVHRMWGTSRKEASLSIKLRRIAPPRETCAMCLSFDHMVIHPCGHGVCSGCTEVRLEGACPRFGRCPVCFDDCAPCA